MTFTPTPLGAATADTPLVVPPKGGGRSAAKPVPLGVAGRDPRPDDRLPRPAPVRDAGVLDARRLRQPEPAGIRRHPVLPRPDRQHHPVARDRRAHGHRDAPPARPHDDLDRRPRPADAPRGGVPVPAPAGHPGHRDRRRDQPHLPMDGPEFGGVGGSPLTLALIDIILVFPFAYRAIDASLRGIDVATLAEAARSLGAGWPRAIFQVILPNIRPGFWRRPCSRSRSSWASSRSRRCCRSTPSRS